MNAEAILYTKYVNGWFEARDLRGLMTTRSTVSAEKAVAAAVIKNFGTPGPIARFPRADRRKLTVFWQAWRAKYTPKQRKEKQP